MCILILAVIPVCMGMNVVSGIRQRSLVLCLIYGYLLMMVSFELVTVPILLLTDYGNFKYVLWIYTPIIIFLSLSGLFLANKKGFLPQIRTDVNKTVLGVIKNREQLIVWSIAFVLLAVMLVLVSTRVIFDGDDAYYVTQSLIAQQKGSMYASDPYTGKATAIDMRHALAVFTMWISYVGTVCKVHTTILCHSILPLVFIPFAVIIYAKTGALLLKDKKEMLGYFVIFIEIFIMFGRVSMYTPEAFLIARTWQGKAVAANILIPITILGLFLVADTYYSDSNKTTPVWILLALTNAAAGVFSSLAVIFACVMIGSGGVVLAILKRKVKIVVNACLCCLPGVLYMLLYLYYMYFGWRSL
ncbi:MAG: hypothetical protein K6G12_05850 [Lachnospiraceae bacterium]|nr:hypothetical protein [Lachnospiraceae bacterium]